MCWPGTVTGAACKGLLREQAENFRHDWKPTPFFKRKHHARAPHVARRGPLPTVELREAARLAKHDRRLKAPCIKGERGQEKPLVLPSFARLLPGFSADLTSYILLGRGTKTCRLDAVRGGRKAFANLTLASMMHVSRSSERWQFVLSRPQ